MSLKEPQMEKKQESASNQALPLLSKTISTVLSSARPISDFLLSFVQVLIIDNYVWSNERLMLSLRASVYMCES